MSMTKSGVRNVVKALRAALSISEHKARAIVDGNWFAVPTGEPLHELRVVVETIDEHTMSGSVSLWLPGVTDEGRYAGTMSVDRGLMAAVHPAWREAMIERGVREAEIELATPSSRLVEVDADIVRISALPSDDVLLVTAIVNGAERTYVAPRFGMGSLEEVEGYLRESGDRVVLEVGFPADFEAIGYDDLPAFANDDDLLVYNVRTRRAA